VAGLVVEVECLVVVFECVLVATEALVHRAEIARRDRGAVAVVDCLAAVE